ncbi:FG-GAP-like repeat-containing protein [Actinophytocola sp. KF-1]
MWTRRGLVPAVTAAALAAACVTFAAPAQAAGDIDLCVSVGRAAGFAGENLVTAVAVAMAESGCDPKATGYNDGPPASVDRGLWQINDYWHDEVTDACAYDAACNARAAYRISDGGDDWTPWATYNNDTYLRYMSQARAATGISAPPRRAAKSVNGDLYDDAVGVDPSGVAFVYRGQPGGDLTTPTRLGPGWDGYRWMGVNDSNADGHADLWAVGGDALYYWNNRGDGTFNGVLRVGGGWSAMEWAAFADVNGDDKTDILGRDGGQMYLYIGKGGGRFAVRYHVSSGWAGLGRHVAADADGDGDGDIWATNGLGQLYYWARGTGSYATARQVGTGWNAFRQMTAMDVNGDGRADLLAIRASDDKLLQWLGTGTGTLGAGTEIGVGWSGWTLAAN